MRISRRRYAQAFITSTNFPSTLDELLDWVEGDPWNAVTKSHHVRHLLPHDTWTAPAFADTGDIVFFHYAARATALVAKLRRAADREGVLDAGLEDFLDHAAADAERYAGTVFAYGILSGPTEYEEHDDGQRRGWRSRLYAPIEQTWMLDVPLVLRDHTDVLRQPHTTILPQTAAEFCAIKVRLGEVGNQLAAPLREASPGADDFAGCTTRTWRSIACQPAQRFRDESQLRGYLADFWLEELRDRGTQLHREARCVPPTHGVRVTAGRADYLVRVEGLWLPVETKLNARAWPGLLHQVSQYTTAAQFHVRARGNRLVTLPRLTDAALIIDNSGVFVARAGAFHKCSLDRPLWTRARLRRIDRDKARRRILSLVSE